MFVGQNFNPKYRKISKSPIQGKLRKNSKFPIQGEKIVKTQKSPVKNISLNPPLNLVTIEEYFFDFPLNLGTTREYFCDPTPEPWND